MDYQKQSSKWTLIFFSILLLGSVSYFTFSFFQIELAKRNVEMTRRPQMAHSGLSSLLNVPKCPVPCKKAETSDEPLLTILLWTWPLGYEFPLNKCPNSENSGCFYTVDRSMYIMVDAVVISHRDVSSSEELLPPAVRPPHQYWIWFSIESPTNCPNLALMDNKMNLTMSYRLDSDIFTPYGWLDKVEGKENFTIPRKTKLVAWVVSNWRSEYRRTTYYQELKKYIPVDVYGEHGLPLPQNDMLETLSMYKFYLAFENSIHEDYITEKFWKNSLISATVPVVMGPSRKNYERFVPPGSFMHVDDFSSPQKLAEHLLRLDKDEERYREYFDWRVRYRPTMSPGDFLSAYCKICGVLKRTPAYRTIPSIAEWFK